LLQVIASNSEVVPSHSKAHRCCLNDHFKFALLEYALQPYWAYDPTSTPKWSGYLPRYIDMLSKEMGFSYEFVALTIGPSGEPLPPTDDATVAIAIVSEPTAHHPKFTERFHFTMPFLNDVSSALVYKNVTAPSLWRFLDPFTSGMWFAICLCVVFSSLLMMVLSALAVHEGRVRGRDAFTLHGALMSLYHAWAAIGGGEDYEWNSGPERLFRLGLLSLILIISSTYTANLASFLTKPQVTVYGPTDITELRSTKVCLLGNESQIELYAGSWFTAPDEMQDLAKRQEYCHDALKKKKAGAFIAPFAMLNSYVLQHCSDLQLVPSIEILPVRIAFAMSFQQSKTTVFMNMAIAHLEKTPKLLTLLQDSFGFGSSCSSAAVSDPAPIDVESMGGLFVVFATVAGAAIVVALLQLAWYKFKTLQVKPAVDQAMTVGKMQSIQLDQDRVLGKSHLLSRAPVVTPLGTE